MAFVEEFLAKDEHILHTARRHPVFMVLGSIVYIFGTIVLWALAALALAFIPDAADVSVGPIVGAILLIVSLVPFLIGVYRISHWWREQYIVTNYRIIQVEGLMNRRTFDSALEKVNDVVMTQSIFGRLFNYGSINIVTGSDAAINDIAGVSDPFKFKRMLMEAKLEFGQTGFNESGTRPAPNTGAVSSSQADTDRIPSPQSQQDQSRAVIALTELRNSGVISDAEFDEKLRQITRAG